MIPRAFLYAEQVLAKLSRIVELLEQLVKEREHADR